MDPGTHWCPTSRHATTGTRRSSPVVSSERTAAIDAGSRAEARNSTIRELNPTARACNREQVKIGPQAAPEFVAPGRITPVGHGIRSDVAAERLRSGRCGGRTSASTGTTVGHCPGQPDRGDLATARDPRGQPAEHGDRAVGPVRRVLLGPARRGTRVA